MAFGNQQMSSAKRFRISYQFKQENRTFYITAHRLSSAEVYAEICFHESIPVVAGMPSLTFMEIVIEAGVTDVQFSTCLPYLPDET